MNRANHAKENTENTYNIDIHIVAPDSVNCDAVKSDGDALSCDSTGTGENVVLILRERSSLVIEDPTREMS